MSNSYKWDKRFMQLTETVSTWSSCFQENRHVGAVVVKDVPENAIVAGVPAKIIGYKDENNLDFQG